MTPDLSYFLFLVTVYSQRSLRVVRSLWQLWQFSQFHNGDTAVNVYHFPAQTEGDTGYDYDEAYDGGYDDESG